MYTNKLFTKHIIAPRGANDHRLRQAKDQSEKLISKHAWQ